MATVTRLIMPVNHTVSVLSHRGLCAEENEDHYIVDDNAGLYILADGMGGHVAGQQASELACKSFQQACQDGQSLMEAMQTAHEAVLKAMDEDAALQGMGTTLVALQVAGEAFDLAWVGDSRAYLWHRGSLQQLTRDHNYAQLLIAQGMEPEVAMSNSQGARLTQAIGVSRQMTLQADQLSGELYRDECLLLCSDGLSDELSDDEIAGLIDEALPLDQVVQRLMNAALDHGGRDNITLLMLRAGPEAAPRPPAVIQRRLPWYRRLALWLTG
ncbi:MAG: protein phosphatase 2C domain-containing protein [Wenzhouxiangellaceae bacterium]